MKKIRFSTVITLVLGVFVIVLLLSPDAKAWVSRGLMAIGLYKPDLATDKADKLEQPSPTEAVGKPSVFFTDGDGDRIDAANQQGKVVFINFWATWCPPCIAELPSIDKLYQQFKDNEEIVFVMVDVDSRYEQSKQFMADKKLTLPVHVPSGNIPGHWLGSAIPTTIILDKQGQLAARHEGMADYSRPEVVEFIQKLIAE
ncbi:TlpA family protein disulfide reductase [Parapedobacter koreensis]|uniref:Thiol-disulfide isomerase or thioredoxin n=1 Tax=Parapedobacter koreensis TaxID=332977 RepID=A0A1H7I0U2_9SPHI|nr:TlpA disulfide reductase family protein [Parapedobacter koreensis]SEK56151.1 Thiol-disulfide isomerase or thioredoxin [Parapedobacter koreensis]